MIPQYNKTEMSSIKNAFREMLEEELSTEQNKNITALLTTFIKKNADAFASNDEIDKAKKIVKTISKMKDEINVINMIADFSNLLIDSNKYVNELDAVINLVS